MKEVKIHSQFYYVCLKVPKNIPPPINAEKDKEKRRYLHSFEEFKKKREE